MFMRAECRKSCQFCTPDAPTEAPAAPVVERPPEPACDKAPDAGSACPFFFTNLVVSSGRCDHAGCGDLIEAGREGAPSCPNRLPACLLLPCAEPLLRGNCG